MDLSRLEYLFRRYVQQECTPVEKAELMELIERPENQQEVRQLIDETIQTTRRKERMNDEVANYILSKILKSDAIPIFPARSRVVSFRSWIRAAAAVVIIAMATYWFIDKTGQNKEVAQSESAEPEAILPGGDRAVLTLADGSTIVLDSMQDGSMQQGGLKMKKQNGLLVFEGVHQTESAPVSWNTLTTPRGGQYKVVLADGSEVWLNASSSLRFPNVFSSTERRVEITGEAYFEVAKDKKKPFKVLVDKMQVTVLGTHFNINAYPDEAGIKTSLLEGSVKISEGNTSSLLKPGQQGMTRSGNEKIEIATVNMEEVMAWKNGLFLFNGADIRTIMNQIGRWYDVDVSYKGDVPHRSFEGKISRDAPLSDVLRILELSGVRFLVSGKMIVVG